MRKKSGECACRILLAIEKDRELRNKWDVLVLFFLYSVKLGRRWALNECGCKLLSHDVHVERKKVV